MRLKVWRPSSSYPHLGINGHCGIVHTMNTTDLFHIILSVGSIIALGCLIFTTIYLVKALKSFRNLIDDADNIAIGIKSGIKLKALAALPALLITLVSKIIRQRR